MSESETESDPTGAMVVVAVVLLALLALYVIINNRRKKVMMTNLKRRRRRCCKKRKKVMMTNLERWRWRCWRCCGCCKPAPKPTRPPRPEETYEYLSLPTGADIEEGDTNHKNPDYTWAAYDANFVHKFQILKDQRIKKAATFGCWRVSENRPLKNQVK